MKTFLPGFALLLVFPAAVLAQVPVGAEFQVNTYTTNSQYGVAVASTGSGNFVVVWASEGQDGSNFGIFGQRFNAAGPLGGEFQVNTYTTAKQYMPAVASDPSGNFVVVWENYAGFGGQTDIVGQRFDALGAPQGTEFRVNSYSTFMQRRPAVAADASGNFVVVWQSDFQDGAAVGVFGQRFNSAGAAQGGEFRVNSYTPGFQDSAAVASDPGGNFLVVWSSGLHPQDGSSYAILGQRYNAAGVAQGSEFAINSYTTGAQFDPEVSADASGDFVVVWSSAQDGSSSGVFGQRLDASGATRGSEFRVNSHTESVQGRADVSSDADGNFAVAWASFSQDGSSYGVFGQRFGASGARRGSEFRINAYTSDSQLGPAIASSTNGNFVVVWNSNGQDGSLSGVFGQRFGDVIFRDGFE